MQQGAKLVLVSVFVLVPIAYAYTVHTQNLWKQQHGKLKRSQLNEWELGVMNENFNHLMAETADQPQSNLVKPNPSQMIFIYPAPQRQPKALLPSSPPTTRHLLPAGY